MTVPAREGERSRKPRIPPQPAVRSRPTRIMQASPAAAAGSGSLRGRHRPPRPWSRTAVVLAGLGALLLAAAGILGYRHVSHNVLGPAAQVESYLAALVSGDHAAAAELLPPTGAATVQDAQIYAAASNRITGYEVLGQEMRGGEAVVRTVLQQRGESKTVDFALSRAGREAVIFAGWQLDHTAAREVDVAVPSGTAAIRLNGVSVPLSGQARTLRLLPGEYFLEGPESRYISYGPARTIAVEPGMAGAPVPVRLYTSATATLAQDVQAQGQAYLLDCLSRQETAPEACPNAAYAGADPARYRGIEWTLTKEPVYRVTGTPETGLAVYAAGGKARATYQEESGGRWQTRTDDVGIAFGSELSVAGDILELDFRP
ncbi:hypothetical protein [Arthrobacter caoxuetaonis]|uniref:hypothetical protein n=1 Tax=Arthrobacter caoxuetaonis TaxID=2886935 RepID=UPI001D156F8C|nr:hypothetical protein [Arthrobacter caoxuetaonis]MCC3281801.1 hypothetical protein [Arthrobacter caoxuetaonis]